MLSVIESNQVFFIDSTYKEVLEALEYCRKERERHRAKARRSYWSKKQSTKSSESNPPADQSPADPILQ